MHFLAVIRQAGGCDYTIGCGIAVELFEALDILDAQQKICASINERCCDETVDSIRHVSVYQLGNKLPDLVIDHAMIVAAMPAPDVDPDIAEYARLKKKFGG